MINRSSQRIKVLSLYFTSGRVLKSYQQPGVNIGISPRISTRPGRIGVQRGVIVAWHSEMSKGSHLQIWSGTGRWRFINIQMNSR